MAMNEFDVVIMRQQDLDRIALSPEAAQRFIQEEIDELREVLEEAKASGAKILERDIQVRLHTLEEKLKAPGVHAEAKAKNLFFDDLGIDLMIVDEAHTYKNIPYSTRLNRMTGLNPIGSNTAHEFYRKTQYLNSQFPKNDSIILASGTPLTNSLAELYNLPRVLQPNEVKQRGIGRFDSWIANYAEIGTESRWHQSGEYRSVTTIQQIVNYGRLMAVAYQAIDSVQEKDMPYLKRPAITGDIPKTIAVKQNQFVAEYQDIIVDRCNNIDADPRHAEYEGTPDNMLRVISNGSAVAIDQRLLRSKEATGQTDANGKALYRTVPGPYANTEMQQDSKVAQTAAIVFRRWQEEKGNKGVQLLYADMGMPKDKTGKKFKYKTDEQYDRLDADEAEAYDQDLLEHEGTATAGMFNMYDAMKDELVRLGIPRNQIAYIHDADHPDKDKKAANLRSLFKKVNAGDIRVLLGPLPRPERASTFKSEYPTFIISTSGGISAHGLSATNGRSAQETRFMKRKGSISGMLSLRERWTRCGGTWSIPKGGSLIRR